MAIAYVKYDFGNRDDAHVTSAGGRDPSRKVGVQKIRRGASFSGVKPRVWECCGRLDLGGKIAFVGRDGSVALVRLGPGAVRWRVSGLQSRLFQVLHPLRVGVHRGAESRRESGDVPDCLGRIKEVVCVAQGQCIRSGVIR